MNRVQGWFDSQQLLRPVCDVPGTADLVQATASLCGAGDVDSEHAMALRELIGEHDHYLFVLVDGLGMEILERLSPNLFVRQHVAAELRAVFPSTTAVALTTLATGRWPADHGVTGWWMYLPERDVSTTTLRFIERFTSESLDKSGVNMSDVFPVGSHLPRFTHEPLSILQHQLSQSEFAVYSSGDTMRRGYNTLTDIGKTVLARLMTAKGPSFTYLYLPHFDGMCHDQGTQHPDVPRMFGQVDAAIQKLYGMIKGKLRIVITADHGLMDIDPADRILLQHDDPIIALLKCPPVGDGRVPCFHVKEGRGSEFVSAFNDRFGDRYELVGPDQAEELQLLGPGPLSDITRRRLGSFIGITASPCVMHYVPEGSGGPTMLAEHAGLSPAEMRVPLILA